VGGFPPSTRTDFLLRRNKEELEKGGVHSEKEKAPSQGQSGTFNFRTSSGRESAALEWEDSASIMAGKTFQKLQTEALAPEGPIESRVCGGGWAKGGVRVLPRGVVNGWRTGNLRWVRSIVRMEGKGRS